MKKENTILIILFLFLFLFFEQRKTHRVICSKDYR